VNVLAQQKSVAHIMGAFLCKWSYVRSVQHVQDR
jgi:hypothetical protein